MLIYLRYNCASWWPIAAIEKKIQNREKTFITKKKKLESTILFQSQKKKHEIEKKNTESRKKIKIKKNISETRKIFWNREKKFRIEKNISESRKIFQNRENCFRIKNYFVRKIEKKSLELNVSTTFLYNSFIACVRLVTVKS